MKKRIKNILGHVLGSNSLEDSCSKTLQLGSLSQCDTLLGERLDGASFILFRIIHGCQIY